VKVRGGLSSNDGETATAWALDGHGILARSRWEVAAALADGRLRRCCRTGSCRRPTSTSCSPPAASWPAKTRALVDFLLDAFEPQRRAANGTASGWSVGRS
jgi:DNA-binding transcriptional LysR family regulator